MEFTGKNSGNQKQKEMGVSSQEVPKTTSIPEHHLTSDVHIRERGHKSETVTHCPHKDSNMGDKDIHEKKN